MYVCEVGAGEGGGIMRMQISYVKTKLYAQATFAMCSNVADLIAFACNCDLRLFG